jgi:hypothetical protein
MRRLRVGFDSDGCLDCFGDGVHEALIARGQGELWKSGPTPEPFWNWYEDWTNPDGTRWTYEQFKELVDWGVDNGYVFSGHFRPNAVESVKRISDLGHEIIIVTDRFFGSDPENSHKATIEAYARAGIEYDELHFTRDKTSVPVDVMVEDKIENYDALIANGTPCYLINRAWNKVEGGDARNRIDDISDYADAIERITAEGYADLQFV